jgi:enoyl-CoA hydratase/carnithine racemase
MELATVCYQAEGGIARIVMNRPEKRNALNHQLLDDLDAAFRAAEDDAAVQVVVLSGARPAF